MRHACHQVEIEHEIVHDTIYIKKLSHTSAHRLEIEYTKHCNITLKKASASHSLFLQPCNMACMRYFKLTSPSSFDLRQYLR